MCSIQITSKANGEILKWSSNSPEPININYISPAAAASNTVHQYSGRHDGGKLPVLKSSGPMADVISAISQAKAECDSFLTACIDKEYGYNNNKMDDGEGEEEESEPTESQAKKIKT